MRQDRRRVRSALLALAALAVAPALGWAEQVARPPVVTVEAVRVEPTAPTVETLCKLWVTLRNASEEKVSALELRVRVNGQELPVYGNHLFYSLLEPGATSELRLYNFWTTETGRPAPADGKLVVEVALVGATRMTVGTEEGVEVWTPVGPVEGLPSASSVTIALAPPPS